MDITHLVVNGCSWTYCQGLDDPKSQGWPTLVGNALGLPVVNLASPGSGNDGIHRRTYEYFFEDLQHGSKPLYIIAWSQIWRREAWCRKYYNNRMSNDYHGIAMPNENPENHYEYALLDNWSEEDFYRKTMLYKLSLDSMFKAYNIPYISSHFSDDYCPEEDNVSKKFSNAHKLISTFHVDSFQDITRPYPKTACGHEGVESQQVLAKYIVKTLNETFGTINPISSAFMDLKEYNKIRDTSGEVTRHEWA